MKILIWGTGRICTRVILEIQGDNVIGYIDSNREGNEFAGKKLYKPYELEGIDYDAIIVATVYGDEIYETCKKYNINLEKVIFAYGNIRMKDINRDYAFIKKICGEQYSRLIKNRYHLCREENYISKPMYFDIFNFRETPTVQNDYVRVKTFELLVAEIEHRRVSGNVAELGVFRGEFAQYINAAFPNKKCYLFDTFDGFKENELIDDFVEIDAQNVFRYFFKETSIDIVMNKMKYPDNVMIKKGYFPNSLEGLEDDYCFVSLDADLEETLFQGLKYFYPRLNQGGYIMMHDYNVLKGAYIAVDKYEKELGMTIPKVPIFDADGSVVITK